MEGLQSPRDILLKKLFQDKYHMILLICRVYKKKKIQTNLSTKQKQTHRLREQTYGYQGLGLGGGTDWEFGIDMYTLLYLK